MVAWFLCSQLAGSVALIPFRLAAASKARGLTGRARQAAYVATLISPGSLLATQLAATAAGLAAIYFIALKRHRSELERLRLFRFATKRPFQAPAGWLAWALMGTLLMFGALPAVVALFKAAGYYRAFGRGFRTAYVLAAAMRPDLGSFLCLALAIGVLAPLAEELVFRGFLLTSLTKWMPTWAAVLCSSVAFAAVHRSLCDMPAITATACVLGVVYVRSKSLMTPVLIHGTWNTLLLVLQFASALRGARGLPAA
jgi:membrane protease YdiL (CAAX protease family)